MIILRADETQTLVGKTALPERQYANEGQALAQSGERIAAVSDRALQHTTALTDHQNRIHATNTVKAVGSDFADAMNAYFYKWDQENVQQGQPPAQSLAAFEEEAKRISDQVYSVYGKQAETNPYLRDALPATLTDATKDAMFKARAHAYTQFKTIGREQVKTQLDRDMNEALRADAQGDEDGYNGQTMRSLAYIKEQTKLGLFNPVEAEKLQQDFVSGLEEKRAYQVVARDPAGFLKQYSEHQFPVLDPKLAKDLVHAAELNLARKVEVEDKKISKNVETSKQLAMRLKNDLIVEAYQDPAAALAKALLPGNKMTLADEFDNTVSTLKALTKDKGIDNDAVLQPLNAAIEQNPTPALYHSLDTALQNGQLTTSTYMTKYNRLTERIEKLKNEAEKKRHDRVNLAVSTYQPMLQTRGPMEQFDGLSKAAQQMFESELRAHLESPEGLRLDPMDIGAKLLNKYRKYISDVAGIQAKAVADLHPDIHNKKDAVAAYQAKRISRAEADLIIYYYDNEQVIDPDQPASSSKSGMVKK